VIRIAAFTSTSTGSQDLLARLLGNLADERMRQGPFAPLRIIVPNRNVETYLRLRICERWGIAANLATSFLRRFLAGIAESASPGVKVADAHDIEEHLLALLHDSEVLADTDLAPVRRFLAAADGDRDALDRRRCQLAAQLAQLFEEYAASRPDMLLAWQSHGDAAALAPAAPAGLSTPAGLSAPAGLSTPAAPAHAAFASSAIWQRALWRAIFASGGRLARMPDGTPKQQALATLWPEAMRRRPAPLAGQAVHVFGLSYVASGYHRMLAELAREAEVFIYTLAPCQESSDELRAPGLGPPDDPYRLRAGGGAGGAGGLGPPEAELASRLWARPGRENLRLLARLEGAVVETGSSAPPTPGPASTVLGRLQGQIVSRSLGERLALDASLRVIPCPSLRRELEVVAAEIWALVRRDPTLRLCDVAVIVPEQSQELYFAQVPSVFGASCQLPHNIADSPASSISAGSTSSTLSAITALLDLPFSSLSRKEVLAVLTEPCVMARFPEATPEMWSSLAAELGIVRGVDRGDFHPRYPARDVFSWDQGLRRLALGALLDEAAATDAVPAPLGGDFCLPGPPIGHADSARLGFALLARSLLADARFAWRPEQPPERTLAEWLAFVRGLVESYLTVSEDEGGQATVAAYLRRLDELASSGLHRTPISYRVAAELARRELAALPTQSGGYLSKGVTVSSFVPMRAIPFRAIFVVGLGQGVFPRSPARHELDLREGTRRAGDVDRREQDLYMFLETLLSAREQVVLSYVARDEITGEELPASSVLLELGAVLGQSILDAADLERWFGKDRSQRPPLRRHDDSPERRAVLPAAEAEQRAHQLANCLRPESYPSLTAANAIAGLPTEVQARLRRVLGWPRLPEVKAEPTRAPQRVSLDILRSFLVDPVRALARLRLGLHDDDDADGADLEDEPYDIDNRERTMLLAQSMTGALLAAQGAPSWEMVKTSFEHASLAAELAGRRPSGIFRETPARREEETLAAWQRRLAVVLGAGSLPMAREWLAFPVEVPALGGRVDIAGQTGLLAGLANASCASLAFTWRAAVGQGLDHQDLRAFLDYVALAAAGGAESLAGHRGLLCYHDKKEVDVRTRAFAALGRERALAYLATLCRELLGAEALTGRGGRPYLLPGEAVLASRAKHTPFAREIRTWQQRCRGRGAGAAAMPGPLSGAGDDYPIPSPDEAMGMVEARFGLFFELVREPTP